MRYAFGLFTLVLFFTTKLYAQSDNLVIRGRSMLPVTNLSDQSSENAFGLSLGYGKVFKGDHLGLDLTAFADIMNYHLDFDADKYFYGTTLFTGLAFTPSYCINPKGEVQITLAVSAKAGYNFGYGTVYRYKQQELNDPRLEDKTAAAGLEIAFSPMVTFAFPTDAGSLGIELGYDGSNYGAGINKLRSTYYKPINFNSGYVFLGVFFRLHN